MVKSTNSRPVWGVKEHTRIFELDYSDTSLLQLKQPLLDYSSLLFATGSYAASHQECFPS